MSWIPKQKVVVPVDFSDMSFSAIENARELVTDAKDVIVLHVLQDLSPVEAGELWSTIDPEMRKRHAANALRERLEKLDHQDVSIDVRIGDPGREIVDLVETEDADMIVLTSHGRTGIKRLLIGSVAERVLRLAHCPVLVLRS